MRSMRIFITLCALVGLVGCKDATGDKKKPVEAARPLNTPSAATDGGVQPIETVRDKMLPPPDDKPGEDGKKPVATKDATKGDQQDADWVPAEFKAGMSRWKDTGVYVDGKPAGFLTFGELPIGLKPTWVKDKVSAEKRPNSDDPGWRWAQQRFYRFSDYLKAIGIEPSTVKEIHIYGPKFSETVIATGKDLVSAAANPKSEQDAGFSFRFGGNTFGKAIPHVPHGFGNGKGPDKISAVMVYIKKKPPKLIWNEGLELDGVMQTGVPYYGEPLRGGVRIYLDDKLAAIIKRQELDAKVATKAADGALQWKLADVLAAQGVDTKKVVELWAIRDDMRAEKFPASDLPTMTFSATSQAKGGVLLTDKKIRASSIALHTRAIQPSEIPHATPDDE